LQQEDFAALWTRLHEIRTYPEQVCSFLEALKCGKAAPDDYPDLPIEAPEEWPALEAALSSPKARTTLLFANGSGEACPVHHISLPAADMKAGMLAEGMPGAIADRMLDLERYFREDRASSVTDDVLRVTGRAPRRFAEYARETAETGVWSDKVVTAS